MPSDPATPFHAAEPRACPTLGELAVQLHARRRELPQTLWIDVPAQCQIDLQGEQDVQIDSGKLKFASPEVLCRITAEQAARELGTAGLRDPTQLFAQARKLWRVEIGQTETACGRLLALAQAEVDVLALAADHVSAGARVFEVLDALGKMLPYVDSLPLPSLISFLDVQAPRTKGDMAAGIFVGAIEQWLSSRASLASRLVEVLLAQPDVERPMPLQAAWVAWARAAEESAIRALLATAQDAQTPWLQAAATRIAGGMLHLPDLAAANQDALREMVRERMSAADPQVRTAAIAVAASLLHLGTQLDSELRMLAEQGDQTVLAQLAQALALKHREFQAQRRFWPWLALCAQLSPEHSDAMEMLDWPLSELLAAEEQEEDKARVLAFLTDWARSHGSDEPIDHGFHDRFQSCASRVLERPELLGQLLTQWFLAGDISLAASAANLLMRHREVRPGPALDAAQLEHVSVAQLLWVARRIIGWIIDAPQVLSLLVSLLDLSSASERVFPWISELLVDEVGYDYPSTTIEYLREAAAQREGATRSLLDAAVQRLVARMDALDALPHIRELLPPLELRRRLGRLRAQQMQATERRAQSRSLFAQIATQVHVKAGTSSFQYLQGSFTDPLKMGTISTTIELPRREVLDPVGNLWRMHTLRHHPKPE